MFLHIHHLCSHRSHRVVPSIRFWRQPFESFFTFGIHSPISATPKGTSIKNIRHKPDRMRAKRIKLDPGTQCCHALGIPKGEQVEKSTASPSWRPLGTPRTELTLEFTMNIGQSFRWRSISPHDGQYVGVLGRYVLALKQTDDEVWYKVLNKDGGELDIAERIEDYFNLGRVPLTALSEEWCLVDPIFRRMYDVIPGARMLRQDPIECLFSFICSQNNHISRIHGMVNKMASMYGAKLHVDQSAEEIRKYKQMYGSSDFYAFPSLEELQRAREDDLRDAGFGYRAKFIEGSVQTLLDMPEGGREWLLQLRNVGFDEAIEELCILPGVGPKVAACVALFSLDKHSSIPVDTHVWQFSLKHYTPHLRGKTNSPKYHPEVQEAFVKRFGEYAGWAHNTLFISELASIKKKLRERDAMSSSSEEDDCWYTSSEDEKLMIETPPNKSTSIRRIKSESH